MKPTSHEAGNQRRGRSISMGKPADMNDCKLSPVKVGGAWSVNWLVGFGKIALKFGLSISQIRAD